MSEFSETVADLSNGRDDFDAKIYAKGESLYQYVQRMQPVLTSEEPVMEPSTGTPIPLPVIESNPPSVDLDARRKTFRALSASDRENLCKSLGYSNNKDARVRYVLEIIVALSCIVLIVVIARRSTQTETEAKK